MESFGSLKKQKEQQSIKEKQKKRSGKMPQTNKGPGFENANKAHTNGKKNRTMAVDEWVDEKMAAFLALSSTTVKIKFPHNNASTGI